MTMAQAIAKSGGLLDFRADPEGVFLYRFEDPAMVKRIKPDSPFVRYGRRVPVIYRLNLREPNGQFLAQSLRMQPRDILYVSNAPLSDVQKALSIFQALTSPVVQGAGVATGFR